MYLYGSFINRQGRTVSVEILTQGERTPAIEIGAEGSGVWWPADDPVIIDSEVNNTFDHLLRHSATIQIESNRELTELYCSSAMDAVVNIRLDGVCVFAGFIEPQAYSQSFNDSTDYVEVNCIDVLSALQYSLYAGVGRTTGRYEEVKRSATIKPFRTLLTDILTEIAENLDISGREKISVYYDDSRKLTKEAGTDIFSEIGISELLFLGDDEDSTWTNQDVIDEIMRYLSLHMEQDGFQFYIFSWAAAKRATQPEWSSLLNGEQPRWNQRAAWTLTPREACDTDTSISIGESYNLISLKCEVTDSDDFVTSPLDSESLTSPYFKRQKYVTTIDCHGDGNDDWLKLHFSRFCGLKGSPSSPGALPGASEFYTTDLGSVKDWYFRLRANDNWKFFGNYGIDLYRNFCNDGTICQDVLPDYMGGTADSMARISAALVAWGSVELLHDPKDNSLQSSLDMDDYLVVGLSNLSRRLTTETLDSCLLRQSPVAEYNGPTSGMLLSPSDDATTNYLVFSGSILLAPIVETSGAWYESLASMGSAIECDKVDFEDGERYYTRKWWATEYPCGPESPVNGKAYGLIPPEEKGKKMFEYIYTMQNNGEGVWEDRISKVAVLACMLIIGDKCLVETGTEGQISDFEWRKFKTREECKDDDEYYEQTFTIGVNPKLNDFIVGTEFDIQNNISFDMGLDMEGTAVPIRHSDHLSGDVKFQILGPVNTYWDDVSYRHRTWFRSAKYTSKSVSILEHTSNIYLKNFEVKICSDNGFIDNDDSDLIYMSDTDERFVNKKDDLTFRFTSALTTEERYTLGVSGSPKMSTPVNLSSMEGVTEIFNSDTGETGKPEQIYVDEAWREWHTPKVLMEQNIDSFDRFSRFDLVKHEALGNREFFVQASGQNLMAGETHLTLKEKGND